jgi:hypothetical protein
MHKWWKMSKFYKWVKMFNLSTTCATFRYFYPLVNNDECLTFKTYVSNIDIFTHLYNFDIFHHLCIILTYLTWQLISTYLEVLVYFKHRSCKIISFDRGYLRERSWFQLIQKIFRVFQNPHVICATTRVNSFTMLGYNSTYFSNKIHKGKTCYSEEQVISMLELFMPLRE